METDSTPHMRVTALMPDRILGHPIAELWGTRS